MAETLISEVIPGSSITATKVEIPLSGIETAINNLAIPGIIFNPVSDADFEPILVALFFIFAGTLTTEYRDSDTANRQLVVEQDEIIRQEQDNSGNYFNTMTFTVTLYSPSNISVGNLFNPSKF